MVGLWLRNIVRILFLVVLQALVVNKLDLFQGMILPLVYIFALLMLPIGIPRWIYLIVGFVVGIMMDAFTNTLGMHTSACTLLGFIIPLMHNLFSPRDGYESNERPTIQDLGLTWYLLFASSLTFLHHTWLFFVEALSFDFFWHTLGKIALSSLATVALMVLAQYLIFQPDKRRTV